MDCHAWITDYLQRQRDLLTSLPEQQIAQLIRLVAKAGRDRRRIFVIGNGGNGANASHFATDLGKGASDSWHHRFRVLSLGDNGPWLTALGNDYSFEDVFVRQLENFAQPGDILLASSVSGNSPNLVRAVDWANGAELTTVALVGGKRGQLADSARHVLLVDDIHYGRVEDAQMTILHMVAYAFMESVELSEASA